MVKSRTHRSKVDYKKIEQLEIELGIVDKPSVHEVLKQVWTDAPGSVIYSASRGVCYINGAFTTDKPINPTTGEELELDQQLELVPIDEYGTNVKFKKKIW